MKKHTTAETMDRIKFTTNPGFKNLMNDLMLDDKKPFNTDQKIMALSWKQPFANLMLHGKIETRTWSTNYRGWVLICASKMPYDSHLLLNIMTKDNFLAMEDLFKQNGYPVLHKVAMAIGCLVDSRPMQPEDSEKCFVRYYKDLYCHVYENVQPIKPFAWKGTQGWKELNLEQKQLIHIL